jgi:hypothetical protein
MATALVSPATTIFGQSRNAKIGFFPEGGVDPLMRLTRLDFVPYIGEVMTVADQSGQVAAFRLSEASDLKLEENERRGFRGESFSLIFESAGKRRSGGDLYQFDHYALGKFSLLLVSVGRSGKRFEAVINRLARPSV